MALPQRIDRRYRILGPLGSGLSGEIFKVEGPEGLAALKLLKTETPGLSPEEAIAHFKFEFSLLKGLTHPHIVEIFDFGYDETLKRFYFTQELVEGCGLLESTAQAGLAEIQRLFVQALQGLSYLHSRDVIHGDIKPENLLVVQAPSGPQLKIIDFGISHPRLAKTGGTPAYLAPEKILKEPLHAKSDLYSLATVFYTVLTGKNPFLRKNVLATLQAHLKFTPPSATALRAEIDPVWSELLDCMLKKKPRERIASAEACLRFLETRGESRLPLELPRCLPQHWTGRAEILEATKRFLEKIGGSRKPEALWLVGEPGLGVESLLRELKYESELQGLEVLGPEDAPHRPPSLFILSAAELESIPAEALEKKVRHASVLAALPFGKELAWRKKWKGSQASEIQLRSLNRDETEAYLQEATRNEKIPGPFLRALFRISRGYPSALHEALENLLKDPRIVDSSGRWHLAVFSEAEPSLEQLGLSVRSLDQALQGDALTDPQERWQIGLRRAEALAKRNELDEALAGLHQLEAELPERFERAQRFIQRARLLEKRGWIYTKQSRYQEAREAYAAALSLLRESDLKQPVLQLRLKNFLAYLDLQEGRFAEAIAAFEANSAEAEGLSETDRQKVSNNELGSALLAAGHVEEAVGRLERDLLFYEHHSDVSLTMKTNYNLAEAFTRAKQFKEAKRAFHRVAETARRERDWDYLIRAYNGLGNITSLEKLYLESLDYYQRSLALAEYLRDFSCAATVAQNRGTILNEIGRLDDALQNLELSKKLITKIHPSSHTRYLMARATLELGEVQLKKGDHASARASFTEALNRAEEDPNLKAFRFYPLASLAKLAAATGETEKFRELYPKLVHLASGPAEKEELARLLAAAPLAAGVLPVEGPAAAPPFAEEAFRSILKINRALLSEQRPESLFRRILEYATELSGAESALLLEVDESGGLEIREAFNTTLDEGQKDISRQTAQRVLQSGESIVTRDALVDDDFNQFASVVDFHLRSIACIPIRIHQKVVGLLYLAHRHRCDLFNPATLALLEAFGDQAGLALQNSRYVNRLQALNADLEGKLVHAEEEIDRLKSDLRLKVKNPYPKILGKSRGIVEILKLLDRISDTSLNVLILGETGSGKELVARSIHENSRRRHAPFVAVNCGAIPEGLIESELFGYRAGAFTGASRDKPGLLEEAHGGTLFLDEIAELPLPTQVKLLRSLQEKEIRRLGDTRPIPVDIRVLSATHRSLEEWMAAGKFREDLYYRIAQMALTVPPLREHREDIPLLCEHFLKASATESGGKPPRLGKDLLELLVDYDWPGNVRELENAVRTASAFAERGLIHRGHLPAFLLKKLTAKPVAPAPPTEPAPTASLAPKNSYPSDWTWERYEAALFAESLQRHDMNCEKVAQELQVGIATVYVKRRKYGLKHVAAGREDLLPWTQGLSLEAIKRSVIVETCRRHQDSPYQAAKQLDLNVGTVYRYLRETSEGETL